MKTESLNPQLCGLFKNDRQICWSLVCSVTANTNILNIKNRLHGLDNRVSMIIKIETETLIELKVIAIYVNKKSSML